MNVVRFQNIAGEREAREGVVTAADRARLSGPGMRAFREIARSWGLGEATQIALLGEPGRSTFHQWAKKAREGVSVTLPLDTLTRISAVLGIHKALAILFEDEAQAMIWLRGAHRGTAFAGASPIEYMISGGLDGLMTVRRYLDAWRGGAMGFGARPEDFEPVTEDDIVYA